MDKLQLYAMITNQQGLKPTGGFIRHPLYIVIPNSFFFLYCTHVHNNKVSWLYRSTKYSTLTIVNIPCCVQYCNFLYIVCCWVYPCQWYDLTVYGWLWPQLWLTLGCLVGYAVCVHACLHSVRACVYACLRTVRECVHACLCTVCVCACVPLYSSCMCAWAWVSVSCCPTAEHPPETEWLMVAVHILNRNPPDLSCQSSGHESCWQAGM